MQELVRDGVAGLGRAVSELGAELAGVRGEVGLTVTVDV